MFLPVLLVALMLNVPVAAILLRRWLALRIPIYFLIGAVIGHVLVYPWLLRNVAAPIFVPQPPVQIYQLHAAAVLGAALISSALHRFGWPSLPQRQRLPLVRGH